MRPMFTSVLIANRGEIAVRICRTLRRMGVRSVVVASIPDRRSLAVRSADAWVLLEGYSAAETYLDVDAIIAAAKSQGCEAIHPGYGFLSERADFAERCASEGLVFVGPPPAVLRGMGDKSAARRLAVENGVPVVPGWDGADDAETLIREAERIGFPVLLKARGGGGGRGMREVHAAADLPGAIASARREALAAFGDGGLLLERLVNHAHHVEVQVIADAHGNVIHLGERDCSVQRRHQKLIEETPSPVVDDRVRTRLTGYALTLARAIGYANAGTFEFLVQTVPPGSHRIAEPNMYFLEVNPRLQVEHPVTETVTGLDLVELQLRVAAGELLPLRQEDVRFQGHAFEFRVNAENPWDSFKPASGRLDAFPGNGAERVDSGFEAGDTVPPQYDSLLMKQISHGETREAALDAALAALEAGSPAGIHSNVGLLRAIAVSEAFAAGDCTVDWLEPALDTLLSSARKPETDWVASAALAALKDSANSPSWIGAGRLAVWLTDGAETRCVEVTRRSSGGTAWLNGETYAFRQPKQVPTDSSAVVLGRNGTEMVVSIRRDITRSAPPPLPRKAATSHGGATVVTAPLAGTIAAVSVAAGDSVVEGQLLLVLEAMKMEHRIAAPVAGRVKAFAVQARDVVREGDLLVELG